MSHAGSVIHNGQFFFDELWNDKVFAHGPYTDNTNRRTLNKDDRILDEENADGNNAFLELELLGENMSDGILGYISVYLAAIASYSWLIRLSLAMGVNSSASYDIHNTNYLSSSWLDTGTPDSRGLFSIFASNMVSLKSACASVASSIRCLVGRTWRMLFGISQAFV